MRALRANLRAAVTAMLLGQLVTLASLPAALCCAVENQAVSLQVSAERETKPCCPGMATGQVCPMHRADSRKDDGPRIRCAPGAGASMPLLGLAGILSVPTIVDVDPVPAGVVGIRSFDALTFDITPTSPPPRA